MKVNYLTLLAGATLVLLSAAATRAEELAASALAADANAAPATKSTTASTAPVTYFGDDAASYYEDSDPVQDFIARAGAWGVHSSGSQTEVGQYQNVRQSSPFFTLDGIKSDGDRTIDLSIQGDDNDTDDARLHYFGPKLEADIDYQRFDHQLYANSYAGFATISGMAYSGAAASNPNYASRDDLNPGQDYAMRVQEWKANFKGNLTDNLKWYVNTFGIEKSGERQANAVEMCLNMSAANIVNYPPQYVHSGLPGGNTANPDQCHVVSQAQHIDWTTTEVEPGLELRLGAVTLNYSHLYRNFNQSDGEVDNIYEYNAATTRTVPPTPANYPVGLGFQNNTTAPYNGHYSTAGYDIVPDSITQMDRLKVHADLGCYTDAYAFGYVGNTGDELNQMNRHYDGGDLRITNKSIENLTLVGYGRAYAEHTDAQGLPLGGGTAGAGTVLYPLQDQFYQQAPYLPAVGTISPNFPPPPPLDRDREAVGATARWLPFGDDCDYVRRNFAVVGGYEYGTEHYQNTGGTADYEYPGTNSFDQPDTIKNTFSIALEEKWAKSLQTFVRYKYIATHYPFLGYTPAVEYAPASVNTALPTLENRVEIGGIWTPCDCFVFNAEVYLETASCSIPSFTNATWDSNSYPYVLSAWWSPTPQWSFNAGFAQMDSWINQNVWQYPLGSAIAPSALPFSVPAPAAFNNRSQVVNLGTRYAWTPKFSTCATVEYVYALNATSIPVTPTAASGVSPYDLGQYSVVNSDTVRLTLGADYLWSPCISTFARYNYYNFEDLSPVPATGGTSSATNTNMTGQANMFLVGMSAKF